MCVCLLQVFDIGNYMTESSNEGIKAYHTYYKKCSLPGCPPH